MKKVLLYIKRWSSVMMLYLLKNVLFSTGICLLTISVVKADVFESFSATRTCLFAVLMCNIWQGIFNSITVFHSEASYIVDDMNKFLPVRTYVFANFLIQLFLCFLEAMACTVIFKFFFDYSSESIVPLFANRSLEYFVTFFLVLMSCDMLAFAVGAATKDVYDLMMIVPLILMAQFLFSGCLLELNGEIMNFVSKITTAKWGFRALCSISDLNSLIEPNPLMPVASNPDFEYAVDNIVSCWGYLGIITLCCTMLSGLLLYLKINSKND